MLKSHDPSLEELRRESEVRRAALTQTVEALKQQIGDTATDLKEKASPAHLKHEVKEYVRESGEQLWQTIERKARENPLQALAVGAGVAYPLWGLLRSVPAPLLLIGAGCWLAKPDNRRKLETAAGDVAGKMKAQAGNLTETARQAIDGQTRDLTTRAANTFSEASQQADAMKERLSSAVSDATNKAAELGGTVANAVHDTAASVREAVSSTPSTVKNFAADAATRSRSAAAGFVDANPLLVAGVGVAVGAFIAACLPPTNVERRVAGPAGDAIKNKTRELASQGIARAKDAAQGVMDDVAAAASREGLDAQGMKQTIEGVTEKVRSVADRGVETALGKAAGNQPQPMGQQQKS
jgi:ElaB/YqjD/DUF883 family membrane-anchored ribosome-binding protein